MTISQIKTDNGFSLADTKLGLIVDIRSDSRFLTVYNNQDKPVATISRPAVYDRNGKWEAHANDGSLIAKTIGPRNAFAAICKACKVVQ